MFKFLFGRSGSGKTQYIIDEIRKSVAEGKRTYLLVPEQQVYTSECMLADLPPESALLFEVISFSRLCEIVFGRFGGLTDASAGSGMRQLIMWQNLREVSGELKQYNHVKPDAALGSMMLSAIDELHANSVTPERCEEAAQKCTVPSLANKLHDLSLVYANFERNLESRLSESAIAFENRLYRLADLLSKHKFFADSCVFIDSFTSFTGEEHAVIEQIAAQAELAIISFTYERGVHDPHTYTIADTVKRLTRFVKDNHIEHTDISLNKNQRAVSEELAALEKHLWDFSLTSQTVPEIPENARGSIEMSICSNEYEEIWLAALNKDKKHRP